MKKKAIDELKEHLDLLKIEKDEELATFTLQIAALTISEKRNKGVCWHPLVVVSTGYSIGDYAYVDVERTKDLNAKHQFRAGSVVRLFSSRADTKVDSVEEKGTIHFVDKNKMRIILYSKDLPEWLSDGGIGVDMLFDERSYREMELAVDKVMQAKNNRLADLREKLLGYGELDWEREQDVYFTPYPFLNDSQNAAIQQVLSAKDVAIIHGPPGTGKTTTLVYAIKTLAEKQRTKTILVCAASNAATDLLTERIAAQGLHVTRIGNISRVDEDLLKHTLDMQVAVHPDSKQIKQVRIEAAQLRREAHRHHRSFGTEQRVERKQLLADAKSLNAWVRDLEDKLIENILQYSQVITCTLTGAAHSLIKERQFETVIIDEAAQALEGATWIPILVANRVVLAGDPYQLPPTVKSFKAQKLGLDITLLEKCIQRLPDISLLNVQYRMNKLIMGFSNDYFYNNALMAAPSVANHTLPILMDEPMIFIDTAGCGFEEKAAEAGKSLYNPEEYFILREHLYQFVDAYRDNSPLPSVGIISPYKEQVNFIETAIAEDVRFAHLTDLDVNTVDGFQGQERDIIYLSLVRCNEKNEIGFLMDYRRMNVALTRARLQLVVIGDSATLGNNPFYAQFLDYCEQHNSYRSAWEWMS